MGFSDEFNQADGQRILVTGATGFVGSRLIASKEAQSRFIQFRAATRKPLKIAPPNVQELRISDIGFNTDWSSALSKVDIVIHLAARVHVMNDKSGNPLQEYRLANVASTLNLAKQAATAGVRRFIYLSSIKVNGEETLPGQSFSESSAPNPLDPYAISKYEAEEGLKSICEQTGMECVIIRPPLIYGPGVKANYQKLIDFVKKSIPLPFGCVSNQRSMLALDNLVDFIILAASHPRAANQTFLLSDGQDLSSKELVEKIAFALGRAPRLLPVPVSFLRLLGFLTGRRAAIDRLLGSLQIDSSKARQLLDWTPPVTVEKGIELTVVPWLVRNQ